MGCPPAPHYETIFPSFIAGITHRKAFVEMVTPVLRSRE